jgi:plastocyanin
MSSFPSQATVIVPIYPGSVNSGATAFGTNPLSIPKGTLVVWINYDTLDHTITSDTGVWDSGVRHHGQNYSYSFDTAGTYPYHDTLYGPAAMSGVITVAP